MSYPGDEIAGDSCAECPGYGHGCSFPTTMCARRAKVRRNVVYISGPMTGIPGFNYPAFHAAAKLWRDAGWEVLNPAENFEGRTDKSYAEYIREDMRMLMRADAIAMLPGWQRSRGAKWELHTAQLLGLKAVNAHTQRAITTKILTTVEYPTLSATCER